MVRPASDATWARPSRDIWLNRSHRQAGASRLRYMSSSGKRFAPVSGVIEAAVTDTERAVLGAESVAEMLRFFDAYTQDRLGGPIARVGFRAGRIDVVWGVELDDGRQVAIKVHRQPVDLAAVKATTDAKRVLSSADFPCPVPLSGPDEIGAQILSVETLLPDGQTPDGRDPINRRLLAEGLARHIDLLRARPDLLARAGSGPAWCRYQAGPWPVPHDPIVDFRSTPNGYAWLDAYAQRAADQILKHRDASGLVVGHADWYAGNVAVAGGDLVATFDWELVADTEAVIAGFTAACYAASSTSGGGLSTPEEAAAFLQDYESTRGVLLSAQERRAAAAAVAWIVVFNARWELALGNDGHDVGTALWFVRQRREDYLTLGW